MHLSAAIPGGGGLTPGTYWRIARDLLTFVANFWPGTGALDRFCTSRQDTRGKTRGICNIAAILKMKDPDRGDWVLPLNGFQNGDGGKGKRVLRFSRKSVPFFWSSFPNIGGGIVEAFCGRILALDRWNLQMSWCKCPGVLRGQPHGMAADKCIISENSQ